MVTFLSLLAFATLAIADHVVHEQRNVDPALTGWMLSRRADPLKVLPLRIGLKQQNMDTLEDFLMSVSHPDSAEYGQHWSPEKVVETFAPAPSTISAVKEWLIGSGFSPERVRLTANKGWITVNATVAETERLIEAEYHVYNHTSGVEQIGCHSYSIPSHLGKHIDIIKPTVHFNHRPNPKLNVKRAGGLGNPSISTGPKKSPSTFALPSKLDTANCDKVITLDCLRALYSIDYTLVSKKNSYGIVEFTPQAFLGSDLDLFFANFSPSLVGARPISVLIDGAVVQTTNQSFDFNGESDLDLQYAMSLVTPQPITLLQTGDLVEGAGFDNWLDAVDESFCSFEGGDDPEQDGIYPDPLPGGFKGPESCGIVKPPHVVSISYGQDESTISAKSAQRQCAEYAKLGLLGTSVFYSSGDNGVAGNGGVCLNSTGQPVRNGTVFNPGFPVRFLFSAMPFSNPVQVTCPFVTAVGATQVNPGATVNDPEGACEQVIFSGGGFSNIFTTPFYQKEAVNTFLTNFKADPPFSTALFNSSGNSRAFPDLSANGANYIIAIDGEFGLVFGTSASSPVVGSMITMVNDLRISKGKGPVGFINPVIYSSSFSKAFHDITSGGNRGCGTPGFTATTGWDPVTGVGTPDLSKLLPLFLALP
ncbi:subtilisin-like protein [Mycena floridula]|nr:subtilisin-like protein [Mycena floridula]